MVLYHPEACAEDAWYVNTVSKHFVDAHDGQNETAWGLVRKQDFRGYEVVYGGYYNTNRKISLLAGFEESFGDPDGFGYGYNYGLVSGYDRLVTPFVGAYLEYDRIRLNIFPVVASIAIQID